MPPAPSSVAASSADPADPADPDLSPRGRLLQGLASALAAKRYEAITIADIVAEASVSRRTFYEHFDGKPACFIALYEGASRRCLEALRAAVDLRRPWQAQVREALRAYLGLLVESPVTTRALLVEVLHLGEAGMAARRRAHRDIAQFICSVVNHAGRRAPPLAPEMALAMVGGIHELLLDRMLLRRAPPLGELVAQGAALVLQLGADLDGAPAG